ncbi:MAG: hypothetical protein ACLT4Y_11245 [Bifidobacterium breve]
MNQPTQTKTAEQGHDLVETLRRGTKFLGHPSAVGTLSFMNLCNGFAYGGMSAVLIYFLYKPAPEGRASRRPRPRSSSRCTPHRAVCGQVTPTRPTASRPRKACARPNRHLSCAWCWPCRSSA